MVRVGQSYFSCYNYLPSFCDEPTMPQLFINLSLFQANVTLLKCFIIGPLKS